MAEARHHLHFSAAAGKTRHPLRPIAGGTRWVISSPTYAYDDTTGAYATISATPARPIIIDYDGKLRVTPVGVRFDRR